MSQQIKEQKPLLSIIILSSNRLDLLQTCVQSLLSHLETYPHWELIIYNHSASQEDGIMHLASSIKGEYVFTCEDDWFFLPMDSIWGKDLWIQNAIDILNDYPEIKFVKLRQDYDGQAADGRIKRTLGKKGFEIACDTVGFNPFITKRQIFVDLIKEIKEYPVKENIEKKMTKILFRWKHKGIPVQVAKLFFNAKWNKRGVCIHTGYGRKLKKIQI